MDRTPLVVRPLADVSPPGVDALVRESLREGFRFLERLRAEHESGANRFAGEGEVLLGAYVGEELVGVGGLNRDPYGGLPDVGRIRHLYVLPSSRRSGLGRALMVALVAHAEEHGFADLLLRTDTAAAASFYEALGFARVADVPGATHRLTLHHPP